MAPAHIRNKTHDHVTSLIMLSPNTSTLSFSTRSGHVQSTFSVRIIPIGKDIQPIALSKMASVNSFTWKKPASFTTLKDTIYPLAEVHTVADVISSVSNELPLDTGAEFQEAQSFTKTITESCISSPYLEPLAFMNSAGKVKTIDNGSDLGSHPDDINFVKLRCTLYGSLIDSRITDDRQLSFQFCLYLP